MTAVWMPGQKAQVTILYAGQPYTIELDRESVEQAVGELARETSGPLATTPMITTISATISKG